MWIVELMEGSVMWSRLVAFIPAVCVMAVRKS